MLPYCCAVKPSPPVIIARRREGRSASPVRPPSLRRRIAPGSTRRCGPRRVRWAEGHACPLSLPSYAEIAQREAVVRPTSSRLPRRAACAVEIPTTRQPRVPSPPVIAACPSAFAPCEDVGNAVHSASRRGAAELVSASPMAPARLLDSTPSPPQPHALPLAPRAVRMLRRRRVKRKQSLTPSFGQPEARSKRLHPRRAWPPYGANRARGRAPASATLRSRRRPVLS